jgi:phospholipid/cholesterol/gamma-HCH transport system substrate-binding protein
VSGQIEQSLGDSFSENALPAMQDVKDISLLAGQFVPNLIENTDKINGIFTNLEETTRHLKQTVSKHEQAFYRLSRNISEVSSALADSKDGVRPFLTKLNQLMEGVEAKEVQEFADKLIHALGSIGSVFDETGHGKNSLGKLLHDDGLYNNLHETLGNLDTLLIDLKTHPWRYVNFSLFGRKKDGKKKKPEYFVASCLLAIADACFSTPGQYMAVVEAIVNHKKFRPYLSPKSTLVFLGKRTNAYVLL